MNRIEIVVIKPAAALSAFADRRRQVVIEHGTGFDEGYPVRVLVPPCLLRIPPELHDRFPRKLTNSPRSAALQAQIAVAAARAADRVRWTERPEGATVVRIAAAREGQPNVRQVRDRRENTLTASRWAPGNDR